MFLKRVSTILIRLPPKIRTYFILLIRLLLIWLFSTTLIVRSCKGVLLSLKLGKVFGKKFEDSSHLRTTFRLRFILDAHLWLTSNCLHHWERVMIFLLINTGNGLWDKLATNCDISRIPTVQMQPNLQRNYDEVKMFYDCVLEHIHVRKITIKQTLIFNSSRSFVKQLTLFCLLSLKCQI